MVDQIGIKLDAEFVEFVNYLEEKYGEGFTKLNGFHESNLNFSDFIDHFVDSDNVANATIDANANANSKDICSLTAEINKPHTKLLAFNKIFYELRKKYGVETAKKWLEDEWNGAFYLHDAASASFKPYCFAYDLEDLATKGLYFIPDFNSEAPKHLFTFCRDVLEFVSWVSNRSSGAAGLPNLLVYMYYFWKKDVDEGYFVRSPEYYRNQGFQEIIYGLNQPYLRVNQSSFTNVTIMDRPYLTELFGGKKFPDGSYMIDHIEELIDFEKAFMEEVSRTREHTVYTFPVITFSLLYRDGKFVDEEFAKWASKHNMTWADSNFFVSGDVTSLSSCCRLVNDFTKLNGFVNSIGGTALKIGSVKVNTINLERIALECNGKEDYIARLKERADTCMKTLDVVRNIIKRNIEKGLLPNYTYGLIELKNQYNTIGINGMYEAVELMGGVREDEFGNKYYTDEGLNFAIRIMDTLNELKEEFPKDYSINIEAVPAERCAVVNYQKDKMLYPEKVPVRNMLGNQWIPLDQKCTLNEKIRLSAVLDKKCGGGQILHANLQGKFPNEKTAWDMLNYIASKGVIYFAFNLKISACEEGHGFVGHICPTCGGEAVETYSRIN